MSNITINPDSDQANGLDLRQLKQSEYFREKEYNNLLKDNAGSLTQVYGNDVNSIFIVAQQYLSPNGLQIEILKYFLEAFLYIEDKIDPERLKFSITKAADDEICINRKATGSGRVKIIINDDGIIAFSYLPSTNIDSKGVLDFYNKGNTDFETLSYNFFSF